MDFQILVHQCQEKIERCWGQDGKIRKVLSSQIKLHRYQIFNIELVKQNFKHNSLLALGINCSHRVLGLICSTTSGRVMSIFFFGQKQGRAFLNNSLLIKLKKMAHAHSAKNQMNSFHNTVTDITKQYHLFGSLSCLNYFNVLLYTQLLELRF